MARRYFTSGEVAFVNRTPLDERLAAFFRCWTLKEAWMKGTGVGLIEPMERFDVSAVIGREHAVSMRSELNGAVWTLQSLLPAHSLVGAIAVEGSSKRLECWNAE